MAERRISSAEVSNLTTAVTDYSVSSAEQDSPGSSFTPSWSLWYGYYKVIPELQAVIDKKAVWTIGRGFEAEKNDKYWLERIRGNGKDTFDSIIQNMVRQYTICGDGFAEIIKNKRYELINLKPLNPGSMSIISNTKGIITGYSQTYYSGEKKQKIDFRPQEIFHLCWNRLGDEPHGTSTIQKLEDIIKKRNEAMDDLRLVFHRYVKPFYIFKLDTDDTAEIASFKAKQDQVTSKSENIYIPKDAVEVERISIPQYSTLDPLPWINRLNSYFLQAEGVPGVILGHAEDTTEAVAKILYLAWQQTVEYNQLFLEQQIKAQLRMNVKFNFPASLEEQQQDNVSKEHKGMNTGTGGILEKKKSEKGS